LVFGSGSEDLTQESVKILLHCLILKTDSEDPREKGLFFALFFESSLFLELFQVVDVLQAIETLSPEVSISYV
jgi:hypothetical protein